jgi:hypothetical protein
MIKFFRKIRQNIFMESQSAGAGRTGKTGSPGEASAKVGKLTNRTGRYFKYAIGEIFLVVIGILIALGINNWNSDRVNNIRQTDYLIAIKSDLEKQIPIIKSLIVRCDSIANTGSNILSDYNASQNFLLIDSLNKKLTLLYSAEKFPDVSTTFDELKSTGQLYLIKNTSVRSKIISYYQNASDSQESISIVTSDIVYGQIYPTLKSSMVILPENLGITLDIKKVPSKLESAIKERLSDSYSEVELFNTINMRIKAALVNRSILLKSGDEAEQLLQAIGKELKLN